MCCTIIFISYSVLFTQYSCLNTTNSGVPNTVLLKSLSSFKSITVSVKPSNARAKKFYTCCCSVISITLNKNKFDKIDYWIQLISYSINLILFDCVSFHKMKGYQITHLITIVRVREHSKDTQELIQSTAQRPPRSRTIFEMIGILPARSSGQCDVHRRTTIRVHSCLILFLLS